MYRLKQTRETQNDLDNLVAYMICSLKNCDAAGNFLTRYYKEIYNLGTFPYAYRRINIYYQGYEIRMKTFSSYNMFFIIDEKSHQIIILRVLKNLQNWKVTMQRDNEYSF